MSEILSQMQIDELLRELTTNPKAMTEQNTNDFFICKHCRRIFIVTFDFYVTGKKSKSLHYRELPIGTLFLKSRCISGGTHQLNLTSQLVKNTLAASSSTEEKEKLSKILEKLKPISDEQKDISRQTTVYKAKRENRELEMQQNMLSGKAYRLPLYIDVKRKLRK